MKHFLSEVKSPRVLEVGIDKGQTFIPLINYLTRNHEDFELYGIDVNVRPEVVTIIQNMDLVKNHQKVIVIKGSSLDFLGKLGGTFDMILLDGDHSYDTVREELPYLNDLSHDHTLVVCDDYKGRWENESGRAIDEFLQSNPEWNSAILFQGEPVALFKKLALGPQK